MSTRQYAFLLLAAVGTAALASVVTTLLVLGSPASAQVSGPSPQRVIEPPPRMLEPAQVAANAALSDLLKHVKVDPSGAVSITGSRVSIKSSENTAIEAGTDVKVMGGTTATVSGGSATTIRGAIVKIN